MYCMIIDKQKYKLLKWDQNSIIDNHLFETLKKKMGNQVCCDDTRGTDMALNPPVQPMPKTLSSNINKPPTSSEPEVNLPVLSQPIQEHIEVNRPYEKELPQNPIRKKFGGDIYEGLLDEAGHPQGMGKMYKQDGSLFIGNFEKGIANGKGRFIFTNGAYYDGEMKNNQADTIKGEYISDAVQYKGGFKANKFHGNGKEKGPKHEYQGMYNMGKRTKGQFKWDTVPGNDVYEYIYKGQFDQNGKFTGKAILREIKGVYEGEFVNGEKHGYGEFTFNNKVKYVGQYKNGLKDGDGTVYNEDSSVCYSGQWKNGLPNGRGYVLDANSNKVESEWKDGVDAKLIEH